MEKHLKDRIETKLNLIAALTKETIFIFNEPYVEEELPPNINRIRYQINQVIELLKTDNDMKKHF